MSRRHRVRYLEVGQRYVCNARFCKFTHPELGKAMSHVISENRKVGTLAPIEESASAPVAG